MIIWDWHNDEFERIKFYTNGQRYIGESVPKADKLITADGHWLNLIPKERREKTIIYPCVKSTEHIKSLGYKYAFVKDMAQQENWGIENSIVLPPIFNNFNEPKIITNEVISIVHNFKERDLDNYNLCQEYGVKNYGFPDNPTWSADAILNSTKYLFHPKEIGYLCNVVIKAINVGTPIIFTTKSYNFGYKDYIKKPLIADTKEQFLDILANDEIWHEQVEYLKTVKENISKLQTIAKLKIKDFIGKVW